MCVCVRACVHMHVCERHTQRRGGSVSSAIFYHCELLKDWRVKNAETIRESSLALFCRT